MRAIFFATTFLLVGHIHCSAFDYEVEIDGKTYLFPEGVRQVIPLEGGKRINVTIKDFKGPTPTPTPMSSPTPLSAYKPIEFKPIPKLTLPPLDLGPPAPYGTYIPEKGEILFDLYPSSTDLGTLRIKNGTKDNAIVKLIDIKTDRKVCSFAVPANDEGGIKAIKNGAYRLLFSFGQAIIRYEDKFYKATGYAEFEDHFTFSQQRDSTGTNYNSYTVTLNPVVDGNAETEQITQAEFDKY
jgi:hypothetical protein